MKTDFDCYKCSNKIEYDNWDDVGNDIICSKCQKKYTLECDDDPEEGHYHYIEEKDREDK